ncbi:TetR/AcrR family transcriptional regulator [Propionibacteriaceae bacterium Y2011]|uniref:TetR/AcrR family transcriptional regulator n=1 Tax=Microlunatus sp. Y2014 TaxID=3418488 RepID=UPI003B4A242B
MTTQYDTTRTGARNRAANLRADAARNRTEILRVTASVLRDDPDSSMADIAAAAGVGRMTLYGHFPTRAELLDAAICDTLDRGDEQLDKIDLEGDVCDAFARVIDSCWDLVNQLRVLLSAAQQEGVRTLRDLRVPSDAKVRRLLERGQREGAFRTDLPMPWLLATTHMIMHGAADEIEADRLDPEEAPELIRRTLHSAFRQPVE